MEFALLLICAAIVAVVLKMTNRTLPAPSPLSMPPPPAPKTKSPKKPEPSLDPQDIAEKMAFKFIAEFPELNDEAVAQLIRNHIIGGRGDRRVLDWAVPETAGRIRRLIMLEQLRKQRGA